jgi:hypothetical protein
VAGLVLSLALVAVVGAVVLGQHRRDPVLPVAPSPGSASTPPTGATRGAAAATLLAELGPRLERGSRRQVVALAAPGNPRAARGLATLHGNVRALGVTDLSFRYLDADPPATPHRRRLGDDAWVGQVQLRWRLRAFDTHDSMMEVPITFRGAAGRATFVTARQDDGRPAPLWLVTRVSAQRTDRSLVVTASARPSARLSRLADRAVVDVRRVLTGWRGRLVVEVPRDQDALTRVLGSQPGAYAEIAAVTTAPDGSAAAGAPVHIFVNPAVLGPLGPRGSQIVMSHEATHVATGAARSSMPAWLLEGFADYVALDHVGLPVSVTASQILALVRQHEAPSHLPGRAEFNPRNKHLGASYESAWLACRLLAERYGERRLVAFYRAADRASSTARAFRTVLGIDQRAFTRAWRTDLRRLAR